MNHNDFTPSILQQPSNTDLAFVEPVCPMGWGQVDERLYLHHRCRLQVTSGVYGKKTELLHCSPQILLALLLSLKDTFFIKPTTRSGVLTFSGATPNESALKADIHR